METFVIILACAFGFVAVVVAISLVILAICWPKNPSNNKEAKQ